ncbi:alpha-2Da adrenergic receptor-like [Oculina patagonica]
MAINVTETSTTTSSNVRSVIHCPHASNRTWDLNETTIHWILLPITFIASLATIILNALVILAVKQKRELKKTSTILLSSMAIADLLVGAISMPLTVTADILIIRQVYYPGFCTLSIANEYSMFTFIWASLYHLTLIAWERYVAIRKTIDYKVIVTRGRIKKLAIVAWLLAAFASFPPFLMIMFDVDQNIKEAWHIGEGVVGVVCLIMIGYFYIMVYLGVRKRKINEISQVAAQVKAKVETKVAKKTGLITATMIFSFVPVIIIVGFLGEPFPVFRTNKAFRLPETLIQLNSLANPLIYFYRDCRFRNAALELLEVRRPQ